MGTCGSSRGDRSCSRDRCKRDPARHRLAGRRGSSGPFQAAARPGLDDFRDAGTGCRHDGALGQDASSTSGGRGHAGDDHAGDDLARQFRRWLDYRAPARAGRERRRLVGSSRAFDQFSGPSSSPLAALAQPLYVKRSWRAVSSATQKPMTSAVATSATRATKPGALRSKTSAGRRHT